MLQAATTLYKIYFYLCRCAQYEVVWFYLLICLVTAFKGENEDEHRLNYGILFQRQIDIQFSSEYRIHK